jgi:hypothetical protein
MGAIGFVVLGLGVGDEVEDRLGIKRPPGQGRLQQDAHLRHRERR